MPMKSLQKKTSPAPSPWPHHGGSIVLLCSAGVFHGDASFNDHILTKGHRSCDLRNF